MDETQFVADAPGKLVSIAEGGHAFIPFDLPANFRFDDRLWPMLAQAKEKVALLEGMGRTLPNPALLLRPLESREALQSTRLEGTYITAKEFFLFELETDDPPPDKDRNDWREVANCRRALEHGQLVEPPFTLHLIRQLHQILMEGIRQPNVTAGEFRVQQVAIGADRRFVPPPAQHVRDCLEAFAAYINAPSLFDPLIHCFLSHYQFETIHPFNDGNGRVGRLLLALMLYRQCGLTKPWLYLSDVLERRREEYCHALFEVSAKGHWNEWLTFCLQATIDQAQSTIIRCDQLQKLRTELMQRLNSCGGSVRLLEIVEQLFVSPFVRITNLRDNLGVSYPTAKSDCDRLEEIGILVKLPNAGRSTYFSREIFNIAYKDIGDDLQ